MFLECGAADHAKRLIRNTSGRLILNSQKNDNLCKTSTLWTLWVKLKERDGFVFYGLASSLKIGERATC
eukprot:3920370-Amphidinium_carterae.1